MTKNLSLIYNILFVKLQLTEAVCETEMQGAISQENPKPQWLRITVICLYYTGPLGPVLQKHSTKQIVKILVRHKDSASQKNYFKIVRKSWKNKTHQPLIRYTVSLQIQRQYLELNKNRIQLFAQPSAFQLPIVRIRYAYFLNVLIQLAFLRCF